jgi:flagellar hook-basal body complex protein FliE
MDLSSIAGISSSLYNTSTTSVSGTSSDDSFSTVLSSMMSALSETNDLQNAAESAEIQFALGESSNTHDLLIATTKAEVALQYTVAVRDKLVDGYKELMQMSI